MYNSSAAYDLINQVGDNEYLYFTVVSNLNKYEKALRNIAEGGTIYCRTLDGSFCCDTKCVGFCWSKLHKGYITKNLMKQHRCIEKNCKSFQKIPDAPYWAVKETKTQKRKNRKELKKIVAAQEADFLKQMRDLTIHDFNFFPIAVELKNDIYEVRIINYKPVDYKYYLSLFSAAADGKQIHFTKITTNNERKQQIIDKHNIVKIHESTKPFILRICALIRNRFSDINKTTKAILSRLWKMLIKKTDDNERGI